MRATSCLYDSRIHAYNVLVDMSIEDYISLSQPIIEQNVFQRRRVRSSKTVYTLLKNDLKQQCVIPPIVLALTSEINDFNNEDLSVFPGYLDANKDHLVILDGLQRTYTILELARELNSVHDTEQLSVLLASNIRVEIYVGLNRLGILYRMLTLNTGQTPMSLRQQIEILYLDYVDTSVGNVELIREADGRLAIRPNQYNFKDIVEGFNSYLDRDELPIEKADILENINSLEKLSKENQETELFEKYLEALHAFISKVDNICGSTELSEAYLDENKSPFGKTAIKVFKRPQSMSGFGAAIGKLIDFKLVEGFDNILTAVDSLSEDSPEEFLEEINSALDWLKNNTKKIGNAQRSYFAYFYRELFNSESEGFGDLIGASKTALRKYQGQNL